MALEAVGIPPEECTIDQVNRVLGAMPLRGAAWEQVAGAASHYGCRATLCVPSTLRQVRGWTDAGIPVLIGWNTGNEWSHASLIFDVTDNEVHIADPNIPNPDRTVRVMSHDDFYEKWWEKSPEGYKVRRPAMAIEREITPDGRQVMAGTKDRKSKPTVKQTALFLQKMGLPPPFHIVPRSQSGRNPVLTVLVEDTSDAEHIQMRAKNKRWQVRAEPVGGKTLLAIRTKNQEPDGRLTVLKRAAYSGNPDKKPIYPHEIDHGYEKPVSGGSDVMQKLVREYQREQGVKTADMEAALAPMRVDPPKKGLEGEIETLKYYASHPGDFMPSGQPLGQEDPEIKKRAVSVLQDLIKALEKGDRAKAGMVVHRMPQDYSVVITGTVMDFVNKGWPRKAVETPARPARPARPVSDINTLWRTLESR
jgi:hypothetical protein